MLSKQITAVLAAAALLVVVGAVVAFAATRTGSSNYASMYRMMGSHYAYQPSAPAPVRTLAAARADAQRFADRLGLRVDEVLQFKQNFYAKLIDGTGNAATEVLVDPQSALVSIEYGPAMMWNTRYGMRRGAAGMMGSYGASMMRNYGGAMMGASGPSGANGGAATTTTPSYGSGMMGGGYAGMMGGTGSGSGSGGSGGTATRTTVTMAAAHSLAQRWLDENEPGVSVESGGDAFPGYDTLETLKDGKITGMISVNATTGAVWAHWWHGAFIAKSEG